MLYILYSLEIRLTVSVEGVKEDIWFELIEYGSRNERMPTLIECY